MVDFYGIINKVRQKSIPAGGHGPVIQFVGDAFLTVDPILAQGFTVGMEGAASLAKALSSSLDVDTKNPDTTLAFDPYILRKELMRRHDLRLHRLICLLRITELVQALGQPQTGTLAGLLSSSVSSTLASSPSKATENVPNFVSSAPRPFSVKRATESNHLVTVLRSNVLVVASPGLRAPGIDKPEALGPLEPGPLATNGKKGEFFGAEGAIARRFNGF